MADSEVRIQSDGGMGQNTIVTTADGTKLARVKAVTVYMEAGAPNRAEIEIYMPVTDIHAIPSEVQFQCPFCYGHLEHHCKP